MPDPYGTITAGSGLLGRSGSLVPAFKAEAEAEATREVRALMHRHCEGTTTSDTRSVQALVTEIEAWWDLGSVDPVVLAYWQGLAEFEYLLRNGSFNGRTGSDAFHRRGQIMQSVAKRLDALWSRGFIPISAADTQGNYPNVVPVHRFREL